MSDFDEKIIERLKRLEREVERLQVKERPIVITDHGALTGLGDNDHPQYLLTTGKAADSDKLDGLDSTGFATASHNHAGVYLPIDGKAANSDKLDGKDSTEFLLTTGKAADSDKLDGVDSTEYQRLLDKQRYIELAYNYGSDASSYIDFHTINDQKDYDARIIASGGSGSVGEAQLNYNASAHVFAGTIKDGSGNPYGRPVFLTTPKTSTKWDGDGYSTVGRTKIDLSSVFGVPDGIKAVLLSVKVRDSASQTSNTYIVLGPTNTAGEGVAVNPQYTNDRYNRVVIVVPCDSNGDIYYDITASGTGTFDVIMQVFGYWL